MEFAESQRAVENREKWGKLVVKSSVVPKQLSRLRDRGEMVFVFILSVRCKTVL